MTRFLAAAIADIDAEEALDWAEELPQGENRRIAIAEVCGQIVPDAPREAADLASTHLPPNSEFGALFVRIAGEWAGQAPADAVAWASRFPSGSTRTAALTAVFNHWTPAEARAWTDSLTDGDLREEALALLPKPAEPAHIPPGS